MSDLLPKIKQTLRMLKEIAERKGSISSRAPGEEKFKRTTLAKVVILECDAALEAIAKAEGAQ